SMTACGPPATQPIELSELWTISVMPGSMPSACRSAVRVATVAGSFTLAMVSASLTQHRCFQLPGEPARVGFGVFMVKVRAVDGLEVARFGKFLIVPAATGKAPRQLIPKQRARISLALEILVCPVRRHAKEDDFNASPPSAMHQSVE